MGVFFEEVIRHVLGDVHGWYFDAVSPHLQVQRLRRFMLRPGGSHPARKLFATVVVLDILHQDHGYCAVLLCVEQLVSGTAIVRADQSFEGALGIELARFVFQDQDDLVTHIDPSVVIVVKLGGRNPIACKNNRSEYLPVG